MNVFETRSEENAAVVRGVWKALNTLRVDSLMAYFHDDVVSSSIDGRYPPSEGKDALTAFFNDFFARANDLHFEFVGEPYAMGDMVMIRQIDHYELDGVQRDDHIVSVLYITDGKIKKWIGQILPTGSPTKE